MASTSGVADAATRSLPMSIRRSLIHCCSRYVKDVRSSQSQATPAGHSRPAPEFVREHLPGNTTAKDAVNACEARAIRDARPPCSRYLADRDHGSEVLLHALRTFSQPSASPNVFFEPLRS